jgi:hypothetical protein
MAPVNVTFVPAFPPPLGVTANFVNPPSISWQLYAFSLPFTGAATLFVALRLYARAYVLRFLGLDDREYSSCKVENSADSPDQCSSSLLWYLFNSLLDNIADPMS